MRTLMCCMTEYPLPFVAASPSRRRLTVFYVFIDKMPARRLTAKHPTAERGTGAFWKCKRGRTLATVSAELWTEIHIHAHHPSY